MQRAEHVLGAVAGMRTLKRAATASCKLCIDINRLENEADAILRSLGRPSVPATRRTRSSVIKWKEIYENLEMATDRCEDVANIIEGVILEHS